MRLYLLSVPIIFCLGISIIGCQPSSDQVSTPTTATRSSSDTTQASTVPKGWKTYTSPEGGFSVVVPGDPIESNFSDKKIWKLHSYAFAKKGAILVIEVYSDRTGDLATNTVADSRSDSSSMVAGSLRDVSLPGMPGIEFRTKGGSGEVVHREYCSSDNSRSITLFLQKDLGGGLTENEVRAFFDSFKLLP
ncbi:MAG: hypothetical protein COA78_23325 [Blastopirellula sp.]|nr:MAG: hypothetical protein COA78_23325 [Blastopirellula sp.]